MKRYGNLYNKIISEENLFLAGGMACLGKKDKRETQRFWDKRIELLSKLHNDFLTDNIQMSPMKSFVVYEPKKRTIHHPPFYPDRIIHHAVMNIVKPIFLQRFTADTYSSITGRGVSLCAEKVRKAVRDSEMKYFLQLDVRHFFENINHDILKQKLRKLFKDGKLLALLDKMIAAHSPGLAIGCYPSQYLANYYLSDIDHYAKEQLRIKHYFRYMDDILILAQTKQQCKDYLAAITAELHDLRLEVKNNVRIAPLECGIDFIGFKFYPTHTKLRKRIKQHFKRKAAKLLTSSDKEIRQGLAPYFGWLWRCNTKNLIHKTLGDKEMATYKRLSDYASPSWFEGVSKDKRKSILDLINKDVIIFEIKNVIVKGDNKLAVLFAYPETENDRHYFITRSEVIKDRLTKFADKLPFLATIYKEKNYLAIK